MLDEVIDVAGGGQTLKLVILSSGSSGGSGNTKGCRTWEVLAMALGVLILHLAVGGKAGLAAELYQRRVEAGLHIRNTPRFCSGKGALMDAAIPKPTTVRVSTGSMMPSSHRRAVL